MYAGWSECMRVKSEAVPFIWDSVQGGVLAGRRKLYFIDYTENKGE